MCINIDLLIKYCLNWFNIYLVLDMYNTNENPVFLGIVIILTKIFKIM